jgi:hypothetical protein
MRRWTPAVPLPFGTRPAGSPSDPGGPPLGQVEPAGIFGCGFAFEVEKRVAPIDYRNWTGRTACNGINLFAVSAGVVDR